jgi:hypothetical protein
VRRGALSARGAAGAQAVARWQGECICVTYQSPVTLGHLRELLAAQEVAHFAAECEKYVGTQSGGMDQAISIMGQAGVAKLISFNPARPAPPAPPRCTGRAASQVTGPRRRSIPSLSRRPS